jgi:predicted lipid-binding transport protein (Tim44 family)
MRVLLGGLRRRHAGPASPTRGRVGAPGQVDRPFRRATGDHPSCDPSLDRGLRDVRRTDPGFDPSRFIGYAGMTFRDAQDAWEARDMTPLRDRLTPEMLAALQAHCDRLRSARRVNRIDEIDITAAVTEAWQESGRDYLTAYISGSLVDYTVDEVRGSIVAGSRTIPRAVEEFWTFTRPAGLNSWMLSAIQITSS